MQWAESARSVPTGIATRKPSGGGRRNSAGAQVFRALEGGIRRQKAPMDKCGVSATPMRHMLLQVDVTELNHCLACPLRPP